MEDLRRQIGMRVRQWRQKKSLSQEALADISEINRTYMGEIERGEVHVTVATLDKIAAALGMAVSTLLLGVGHGFETYSSDGGY